MFIKLERSQHSVGKIEMNRSVSLDWNWGEMLTHHLLVSHQSFLSL